LLFALIEKLKIALFKIGYEFALIVGDGDRNDDFVHLDPDRLLRLLGEGECDYRGQNHQSSQRAPTSASDIA